MADVGRARSGSPHTPNFIFVKFRSVVLTVDQESDWESPDRAITLQGSAALLANMSSLKDVVGPADSLRPGYPMPAASARPSRARWQSFA